MNLARIVDALGPAFRHDAKGGTVIHTPTGTTFVAIPGGTFTMGFTLDDIRAVWCAVPSSTLRKEEEASGLRGEFTRARPPRRVSLEAFLVATEQAEGKARPAAEARRLAHKHGFRLPTEAEWEWIAREGGAARFTGIAVAQHPVLAKNTKKLRMERPNGFGVGELQHEPEWVGDDHVTRFGHIAWQDDAEICALHAAYRSEAKEGHVRFALDLPAAVRPRAARAKAKKGVDVASIRETLDGLAAADPLPSVRAIESALLDPAPGDDLLAVLAALPRRVAKMKSEPAKAALLRALGTAATKSAKLKRALAANASFAAACGAAAQVVVAKKAAKKAKDTRERTSTLFPWMPVEVWESFNRGFYYPKDARAKAYQLLARHPELLADLEPDAREARVLEVLALRVAFALKKREYDVTAEGESVGIVEGLMPKCPTAAVARAALTVAAGGFADGAAAVKALAKYAHLAPVKAELARFAKLRISKLASYPARVAAVHGR